jgi:hypothetical protein
MSQQDKEVEEKKDEAISRQDGQAIDLLDSARPVGLSRTEEAGRAVIIARIDEHQPAIAAGFDAPFVMAILRQRGQAIGLLDAARRFGLVYQDPSLINRYFFEIREVNPNRNPQPVENRQGLPRLIPVRPIPLPLLVPIALPSIEDVDRNVGGA